MTKYVLNSGGIKKYPNKATLYIEELFKNLDRNPKVLLCFFAQQPETWESYFDEWQGYFTQWASNYSPNFRLASVKNFEEECKWTDVIYIHGGYLETMCPITDQFDLEKLFDNKIVGLNSASSMLVSAHFWSVDTLMLGNGLGILPIKFFAHFKADDFVHTSVDWNAAHAELADYGDATLPIHALEEGDFIVIEK